jgi:hypothetical protein
MMLTAVMGMFAGSPILPMTADITSGMDVGTPIGVRAPWRAVRQAPESARRSVV